MRMIDLTGQRFGRLTVLRQGEDYLRVTMRPYMKPQRFKLVRWHCRCDCGREVDVLSINLRAGKTRSCGCLRRELLRERRRGRGNGGTSRTPSPTAETEADACGKD